MYVSVHSCVCMCCACMCAHVSTCVHVGSGVHACMCAPVCAHVYECACLCMCMHAYACVYACMCICVYARVCVCVWEGSPPSPWQMALGQLVEPPFYKTPCKHGCLGLSPGGGALTPAPTRRGHHVLLKASVSQPSLMWPHHLLSLAQATLPMALPSGPGHSVFRHTLLSRHRAALVTTSFPQDTPPFICSGYLPMRCRTQQSHPFLPRPACKRAA